MNRPLQIVFRPRFDGFLAAPDAHNAVVGEILASWREAMPESKPQNLDFEDWVENAIQLHHALRAVRERPQELALYIDRGQGNKVDEISPIDLEDQHPLAFDPERPFMLMGMEGGSWDFARTSPMVTAPSRDDQLAAEAYVHNPGFWAHAGRQMRLSIYDDGESNVAAEDDLVEAIKQRRDEGQHSVFVKVNEAKAGVARLQIAGRTDAEIAADLMEAFEWTLVRMGGISGGFLIQDDVVMEHEYRVFVVDGKAVTGAGCVGEHTPLDNRAPGFDLHTRRVRPNVEFELGPIEPSPDVIERYKQALPQIIEDLMRGDERLQDFVVDLCLIDDEVCVVEVNPSRNAGLYAIDVQALVKARIDKGLRQSVDFERESQQWLAQREQLSKPGNRFKP